MAQKIDLLARKGKPSSYNNLPQYFILFGMALFLLLGGMHSYQRQREYQEQLAQEHIWPIYYLVEAEEYEEALEGNGITDGLYTITTRYPGTKAAQQAHIFIGHIFMKQGRYEEAIQTFATLEGTLLWGRVQEAIGDAYLAMGEEEKALASYQGSMAHQPNRYFTPMTAHKAAQLHERRGDLAEALEIYEEICKEYPNAPFFSQALQHAARLRARLQRMPSPLT